MTFKVIYARSVKKDIDKIHSKYARKIKSEIEKLNNFPDGIDIKKLTAHFFANFRLRIGDYRVLFDVDWDKKEIIVLKIGHRKDIY